MKALIGIVGLLTVLVILPLAGAALGGRSLAPFFHFPPPLEIPAAYPRWSWLAGALVLLPFAAIAWSWRAARRRRGGDPAAAELSAPMPPATLLRKFPVWGWLAVGWTAAWWMLAWTRFAWFAPLQLYTFFPLWIGFIVAVNALTVRLGGQCLMQRDPRAWLRLFAVSAVFWWLFEWLNRFVHNWHYLAVADFGPAAYAFHATLCFSTVLPAVAGVAECLAQLPGFQRGVARGPVWPWFAGRRTAAFLLIGGMAGLVLTGARPLESYPALWSAPLALAIGGAVLAGRRGVWDEIAAGDWQRTATWAASAVICGAFWEMWNYYSVAKWIYTVPFVDRWHVFEMPVLGYLGYLPFGLECLIVVDAVVANGRVIPTVAAKSSAMTRLSAASLVLLASVSLASNAFAADASNPLLQESTLPYNYPPFDRIKDEHFAPAFKLGMEEQLREVDAIARASAKPTFDNTVVALERSGRLLGRAQRTFSNLAGAHANDAIRALEKDLAPKLAAHTDAIRLNAALFARLDTLQRTRDQLGLDAEAKHLLDRYHKDFVRAGAKLSEADKTKLKAMNAELAQLTTTFSQNVLKETNASAIVVDRREDLAGLSPNEIAAAEAAAKAAGQEGKFVLRLINTSGQPALASLENRALREKLQKASVTRSMRGGDYDNRAVIARIARLRAERAVLLGYPDHAAYQLQEQTARTVSTVNKLLADLAPPAVANARREAADLQAMIDREKGGFQLAPWDWSFYSEKVRKARYAYDEAEVKPYFELNRVLIDGVFFAATKLYGITFKERKDLPVYEPSVRVFEVFEADGSPLAIFMSDNYARPSKRGGAWNAAYVLQSGLFNQKPVYANHLNIPKPPDGQPTLLTFDEVNTLFHEFGHALHGMFSAVKYPRFAGTQVPRDFVEFPSQVNEMWMTWPEILKNYAKHHQTGALLPPPLLDKILAAEKFNQGFETTEILAAMLLDQSWHQLKPADVPAADGVLAFEAAALKKAGVDFPPVPSRYRSTYFSHIFSGAYSAGYYSYLWSEVLDADSVEWFKTNGGLTRRNGDHFRKTLLSRGGSVEAMDLFRAFRGADPDVQPVLKRRGLEKTAGKSGD